MSSFQVLIRDKVSYRGWGPRAPVANNQNGWGLVRSFVSCGCVVGGTMWVCMAMVPEASKKVGAYEGHAVDNNGTRRTLRTIIARTALPQFNVLATALE